VTLVAAMIERGAGHGAGGTSLGTFGMLAGDQGVRLPVRVFGYPRALSRSGRRHNPGTALGRVLLSG
jgi:hypothetical protein